MVIGQKIRVLIADDSVLTRRALSRMLESDPNIEVISEAHDGREAIEKARNHQPDVVTLDINMPRVNGLEALQAILADRACPIIMVSSLTQKSADATLEALTLGAFDCVAKPTASSIASLDTIRDDLVAKVKAAVRVDPALFSQKDSIASRQQAPCISLPNYDRSTSSSPKAIVIAISTGGPTSIQAVLPKFSRDIDATIYLVQHLPVNFTASYARRLDTRCTIQVCEASSGMTTRSGTCYVGQGGYHLVPARTNDDEIVIQCVDTPKETFMPSASITIKSVMEAYGPENTIGVIMTGIGRDGVDSLLELKQRGGYTIAEREDSCVVYGMPKAAFEAGAACDVLPKQEIASAILKRLKKVTAS